MQTDKSGKKLVIYSAANAHGYMTCIVHRLLYNKNSYCVYVGDDCTAKRTGGLELFDDYILYKQIAGDYGYLNKLSPQEYESFLIKYFDDALANHGIAISEASELYIGSNWSDFPIYVNLKGIRHNIFQEAIGDLGLPRESWAIRYPCQLEARKKTGMLKGIDNDNIIAAYVHPLSIKEKNNKFVEFDIVKAIQKLEDDDKSKIKKLFKVPEVKYPDSPKVLLLTQWFRVNNEIWNDEKIIEMYCLLLDLYSQNTYSHRQIIIKPHPADPKKNEYKNKIIDSFSYDVPFPSECLGLVCDSKFELALTISSSSINTVQAISEKQLSVKFFEKFYQIAPEIFLAARIVKLIGLRCFNFGVFSEVMLPLIAQNKGFLPDTSTWYRIDEAPLRETGAIIIYDYVWRDGVQRTSLSKLANCPKGSCAFIISDDITNLIQSKEDIIQIKNLYKLDLTIKPYMETSVFHTAKNRSIYIFCADEKLIETIKKLNIAIIMPFSKAVILQKEVVSDLFSDIIQRYFVDKVLK